MDEMTAPLAVEDLAGASGAALLSLNNAHALELSWLEPDRFAKLVSEAFVARRAGADDALLLAFDQDADYDSVNFLWFRERFDRFVYVDRVVVADAARGRGLARRLYDDLFAALAPPATRGSSARSTPTRRTRRRTPSTRRSASFPSEPPRSMAARRR